MFAAPFWDKGQTKYDYTPIDVKVKENSSVYLKWHFLKNTVVVGKQIVFNHEHGAETYKGPD